MGLRRADRDLAALTVLALLRTGPRHPYEMHRFVLDTRKDFVTGLPRSLYHAVDRLLRDDLVTVHGTDRSGSRPERTLYALTDAGDRALSDRVRRLLETPEPDTTPFVAALSFIGCLRPADAAAALRVRAAALDARIAAAATDRAAAPAGLPRFLLVESEFEDARCRAERDWTTRFADDIDAGRIGWPTDPAALEALLPDPPGAGGRGPGEAR